MRRQVGKRCLLAIAVVKRDFLRQADEFLFVCRIGANRAAMFADVVAPVRVFFAQCLFRFIRAVFATDYPKHQDAFALYFVLFGQRMVVGADSAVAQIQQFFLDVIELCRA